MSLSFESKLVLEGTPLVVRSGDEFNLWIELEISPINGASDRTVTMNCADCRQLRDTLDQALEAIGEYEQ